MSLSRSLPQTLPFDRTVGMVKTADRQIGVKLSDHTVGIFQSATDLDRRRPFPFSLLGVLSPNLGVFCMLLGVMSILSGVLCTMHAVFPHMAG